jgi:diguanylate cyclase (GGDEF)-like protein
MLPTPFETVAYARGNVHHRQNRVLSDGSSSDAAPPIRKPDWCLGTGQESLSHAGLCVARRAWMDKSEPSAMIATGLTELRKAAELEGAAVLDLSNEAVGPLVLHDCGLGSLDTIQAAGSLLYHERHRPSHGSGSDRRPILVCPWSSPVQRLGGLAMWRMPGTRAWTVSHHMFAASIGALVRTMLEHEGDGSGLDRLTSLPNRRYFLDEVDHHIERLDLDRTSGTMMMIDLDGLERFNHRHGRPLGDRMLVRLATLLRAMVRPTDIVARIGPDEFAVWLDGMDHMTAAERADTLVRRRLSLADWDDRDPDTSQTVSIGIATRRPGSAEDSATLLRRAYVAMRDVKQAGGGAWRVSHVQGLG